MSVSTRSLLQGLNQAQERAVLATDAPLCILAGAGSGKTRVLTRRIAHRIAEGTAEPQHTLAITFTRKAAGELTKRLSALGVRDRVATGTFHSVAYNQLRQYWAEHSISAPTLTQSKLRILMPLVTSKQFNGLVGSAQPTDLATEIEWAKARLITPDRYVAAVQRAGRKPPLGAEAMAELYSRYEADKRRRGVVDFDDLLVLTVQAMEADREFAARQRWRFRHLFVDEFQDVNPAQARLLDGWLGLLDRPLNLDECADSVQLGAHQEVFSHEVSHEVHQQLSHELNREVPNDFDSPAWAIDSPIDLCVVGDPNQAIYGWNGADPRFLAAFRRRFPHGGFVRLEDNYRSSPQVLTVADAVLGLGSRQSRALRPNRPDGPIPLVTAYPSDIEEARAIARMAREHHHARVPWKHMAVLTRTNAQLLLFEEAFRAAGIPHRVRGGQAFLQQPEVLRTLSMLSDGPAGIPLASRLNDLEELIAELRDDQALADAASPDGSDERIAQIEGVIRMAHEYLGIEAHGSVAGFLTWLHGAITSSNDEPQRQADVVELSTFHRAKGLEWPVVFVAGLERGYVPMGSADTPEARAEEQRLLYVAVTRAESVLCCSWAKSRTFGSRTTSRSASYWIENIEAAIASMQPGTTADWQSILRDMKERVAAARAAGLPGVAGTKKAAIDVGSKADPAVYQRLKAWRAAESRLTGVAAFTILHDTSLAAIAEARPTTEDDLLLVPGVGPLKVSRYGQALLAVVREATAGSAPAPVTAASRRPA
jgi:DNA helicase II / ATP-dependent DNA helicase PcrA